MSIRNPLLISLVAASLSTLHITPFVSAQIPVPLCCMAYATTHDQKTFFVQGRASAHHFVNNQFFSLDLTQPSWNTTAPPWKPLSVGAGDRASSPVDFGLAMAISKDGRMLMEWGMRIGVAIYDIEANVWIGKGIGTGKRTGYIGYQAATDPNTGLVYIPAAMNDSTGMMVYSFATKETTLAPMPSVKLLRLPMMKYAWAWNGVRQSMLLHGGANYDNFEKPYGNPNLLEFLPTTSTWRRLTTKGQRPPPLSEHCMVSAQGGSKMVVYGGTLVNVNSTLQGDVYILDVASLTWTKAPSPPGNSHFRRNMACTAAGNNFVVWGGQSFNLTFLDTAVFDLRSNKWTTQFFLDIPTPTPTPISTTPIESPTPTKTGGNANSENSTSNVRGKTISIIIGVASSLGILIIGACILFCLRRRRRNKGGAGFSRIQNVNVNNKPKRASKRWSGRGPANNQSRDSQEARSLQHQLFEQERRSQEKSVSRSNSEKSDSVQLLSPTMTDNSDTLVALNSGGMRISQEEWLRRQREEVNQERQALVDIHMQQLEYQRQMEALRTEAYTP
ncbi:hypothetical protein BG015_010428 [Linnemannia schmuckeri]|uniref:Galactose oxidase n=1 Tax=Linnemannia schmuckeri TaxID=64567 RepID=A0A9P5RW59_9FUNG|nr:hypothetical protein BG015_010428 [Linnemannia schmuckeri]